MIFGFVSIHSYIIIINKNVVFFLFHDDVIHQISSGGGVIDHTDFTANSDGSGFFQSLSVKSSDGNNTYYLVSAADRNNPTRIRTSKDEVFCFDFSEKYSDDFLVKLNIGWESIIQRRFEIDGF